MRRSIRFLVMASTLLTMVGCATMQTDFDTPIINVRAVRPLPAENLAPQFEVTLHIVNPNRAPLVLQGIACTLTIDGHNLLTGVANDLPVIDGYGDGDITLTTTTSLLNSIRLFADLMNAQRDVITYDLEAKLDLGGLRPTIRVVEKGQINLSGQRR